MFLPVLNLGDKHFVNFSISSPSGQVLGQGIYESLVDPAYLKSNYVKLLFPQPIQIESNQKYSVHVNIPRAPGIMRCQSVRGLAQSGPVQFKFIAPEAGVFGGQGSESYQIPALLFTLKETQTATDAVSAVLHKSKLPISFLKTTSAEQLDILVEIIHWSWQQLITESESNLRSKFSVGSFGLLFLARQALELLRNGLASLFFQDSDGKISCHPKQTIKSSTAESIFKARDLIRVITREHSGDFLSNGKHIKVIQEQCENIMTRFISIFFPTPETRC